MDIGIPKETFKGENRIPVSPIAARMLADAGHSVYLEAGAGNISFYDDANYQKEGATIVYNAEEVFVRSQLIAKVERPNRSELEMLQENQILMSFLQPAAMDRHHFTTLLEKKITSIGYEIIQKANGDLPIVRSLSEMSGQMSVVLAGRFLGADSGGRGILLGGAPGVPPAEVVIIGAGNLGRSAARYAVNMGASVTLLDVDVDALRKARRRIDGTIVTAIATPGHIEKALSYADVLITAIHVPGGGASQKIVTRRMVQSMKRGSVIIDTSIDLGGAVETSRPTTLENPTYVAEGVLHYCVPNISSAVPRTASRVLADSVLPYLLSIAGEGLDAALLNHPPLGRGVFTYGGHVCNQQIAELFDMPYQPLEALIGKGGSK